MLDRAYDMTKRSEAVEGTKRRIAEKALELFRERDYDTVTLNEIARAAGVSHQTVLNHFGSKAGVLPLAGAVFTEQVGELQAGAVAGDVASVVGAVCTRYEAVGDANCRWAALSGRIPEVAERLAEGRAFHQAWLEQMLGDRMPEDPEERRRVLLGLHAALDVFTWKLFRRDLELSREQTELQLTDLVRGVLARHRS